MSAAHTPGPWRIESMKHVLGLAIWSGTPHGADEFRVAGVAEMRGAAEANARLIAAAPDLLEALQNMHNVLNEAMSTGGWIPTPVQGSFRDAWVEVTESIAKATGAQP